MLRARGETRATFSPRSSSPLLCPLSPSSSRPSALPPRFTSSFPKYSELLTARLAVVTADGPGGCHELINIGVGFGGCSACVPLCAPSPARPRCPSPRKPGLIPGLVTSSLPGGWSGGNKAGFVPLPHTHPRARHPRSVSPPGVWELHVPESQWLLACREQFWFISFGSQAWEALRAGCFHVWVTRESRALAV